MLRTIAFVLLLLASGCDPQQVGDLCTTSYSEHFRRISLSRLWIIQYGETDNIVRFVVGPDDCRE
jgi:hypothetical protein